MHCFRINHNHNCYCYVDGIELQHIKKLTDDTVDTTGVHEEVTPSSDDKVDHEDIDLPISPTADITANEGHFKNFHGKTLLCTIGDSVFRCRRHGSC